MKKLMGPSDKKSQRLRAVAIEHHHAAINAKLILNEEEQKSVTSKVLALRARPTGRNLQLWKRGMLKLKMGRAIFKGAPQWRRKADEGRYKHDEAQGLLTTTGWRLVRRGRMLRCPLCGVRDDFTNQRVTKGLKWLRKKCKGCKKWNDSGELTCDCRTPLRDCSYHQLNGKSLPDERSKKSKATNATITQPVYDHDVTESGLKFQKLTNQHQRSQNFQNEMAKRKAKMASLSAKEDFMKNEEQTMQIIKQVFLEKEDSGKNGAQKDFEKIQKEANAVLNESRKKKQKLTRRTKMVRGESA